MAKRTYKVVGQIFDINGRYVDSVNEISYASSEKQAVSNVLFRWKKNHDAQPWTKFTIEVKSVSEV